MSRSKRPPAPRVPVGYAWTVYHSHSSHGSQPGIVAGGVTEKPGQARQLVESVMSFHENAVLGTLVRVVFFAPAPAPQPGEWPPAGEIWMCLPAVHGGFTWARMGESLPAAADAPLQAAEPAQDSAQFRP